MRALVISGGGGMGAFAGGAAEYLIKEKGREYQIFVGTSTGSLLVPFLAGDNLEKAKNVYTNIRQEDIFALSPFDVKREDGKLVGAINRTSIMRNFWNNRVAFADNSPFARHIKKHLLPEDFYKISELNREVIATVSNLSKHQVEYKSSKHSTYSDFCDWVLASASVIPFMKFVTKNGSDYGDGGFGNFIPILPAINRGATEIDVIILRPEKYHVHLPPIKNVFESMMRTYEFMFNQITKDDIEIGNLAALHKNVAINYYHTPRLLTENSFIFDKEEMRGWWKEGFEMMEKRGITNIQ